MFINANVFQIVIHSLFEGEIFILNHWKFSVLVQTSLEQQEKEEEEEEWGEEQSYRRQVLLGTLTTSVVLRVTISVLSCDIYNILYQN